LKPSLVTLIATIVNESAFRDVLAVIGGPSDNQTVTPELLGTFWQTFSFEGSVKSAGTLHAATVPV
jgi:hypothetical protein